VFSQESLDRNLHKSLGSLSVWVRTHDTLIQRGRPLRPCGSGRGEAEKAHVAADAELNKPERSPRAKVTATAGGGEILSGPMHELLSAHHRRKRATVGMRRLDLGSSGFLCIVHRMRIRHQLSLTTPTLEQ
jgi:hypothetical protein